MGDILDSWIGCYIYYEDIESDGIRALEGCDVSGDAQCGSLRGGRSSPFREASVALILALTLVGASVYSARGGVLTFTIGMVYTLTALMMAGIWGRKARKNENVAIGGQLHPGG
jgi:hypothetical protein